MTKNTPSDTPGLVGSSQLAICEMSGPDQLEHEVQQVLLVVTKPPDQLHERYRRWRLEPRQNTPSGLFLRRLGGKCANGRRGPCVRR